MRRGQSLPHIFLGRPRPTILSRGARARVKEIMGRIVSHRGQSPGGSLGRSGVMGPGRVLELGRHGITGLCGHGILGKRSEEWTDHTLSICIKYKLHGERELGGHRGAVSH